MSESPLHEAPPADMARERRANLAFLALIILVAVGAALLSGGRGAPDRSAAHNVEARY